jgi:GGDEF domain-containing protein
MNHEQVLDVINLGIVIIDSKYNIIRWNRWMEIHSQKGENEMVGSVLFKHYPHLSTPSFLRSCKSVLKFGNFVFHSQKLHNYLFPFKPTGFHVESFDFMQQSCTLTPLKNEKNEIGFIVITVTDVTENVYLEKSLKLMSQQDGLTKTFNRRYLDRRLEEEYTRFSRKGSVFCILMIDIDDFKNVNDSFGHQFGDIVLKEIAQIGKSIIRGSDLLARYGEKNSALSFPIPKKKELFPLLKD